MHVHLIAPTNEDSTYIKPLWAATLAAHTPPDVELTFRDDGLEPIDVAKESDAPDLVAISVNSKTAARAYALADAYRARGTKVVLGGIHVTALPDEGLLHADAVVSGEAEWLWQDVVRDAREGAARQPAVAHAPEDLQARRDARARRASRCPVATSFARSATSPSTSCRRRAAARSRASSAASRPTTARRSASAPIPEVMQELQTVGPRVLFGDDNVMIHTKYSHDLFEAMVPLKKVWVAQASLAALHRVENIEVMARAGCKALFIGFESVEDDVVRTAGKRQNKPRKYQRHRALPRRPWHRRVGELRLRLRRGHGRLLRAHGRVLPRVQAHDGPLRAPHAVPRHAPRTSD